MMGDLVFQKISKCVVTLRNGETVEIEGEGTLRIGDTEIKNDPGKRVTPVRGATVTMRVDKETASD